MAKSKSKLAERTRPTVVISLQNDEALLQGIAEQASKLDWRILDLRSMQGSIPTNPPPVGALISCLPTDPLAVKLHTAGCPAVRLGAYPHPQDDLLPAVLQDTAAAGRMAAEHFAGKGFKHVAYVGHKPWSSAQAAYEAFHARAVERDCTCHLLRLNTSAEASEKGSDRYELRAKKIVSWIADLPKPLGLLGYNDNMAAQICGMCCDAKMAVPEDVAILGYGNDRFGCEFAPVPISSIEKGDEERGKQAVLLLQKLISGEKVAPTKPIMIPPKGIIERQSTDVLAVADPIVARAMRFMWDHIDQPLLVNNIADKVAVPRRKLERAFQRSLGRGINAELRRKRLEQACHLLRTTKLTISAIAPLVGYRSTDYLHESFRRAYGMTPRKYRMHEQQVLNRE